MNFSDTVSVNIAVDIYYALYSPVKETVLYSIHLYDGPPTGTWRGDLPSFINAQPNYLVIPIDPFTALNLDWISEQDIADYLPQISDNVKAAIRLLA